MAAATLRLAGGGEYHAVKQIATECETGTEDEEGKLGRADQPVSPPPGWGVASRVVAAAVALAACSVATAAMVYALPSRLASQVGNDDTISAAAYSMNFGWVAPVSSTPNQGCANWDTLKLEHFSILDSQDACNVKCSNTPGCGGYNYQKTSMCSGDGFKKGACYLWASYSSSGLRCKTWANDCWDNHQLITPVPAMWSLTGLSMGCSNWKSILVGEARELPSAAACGVLCSKTANCTGFGYQVGFCSGNLGVAKGTCYLWGRPCLQAANSCWHDYEMVPAPAPTPTARWTLTGAGVGCKSWDANLLGHNTFEASEEACGLLCQVTPDCVEFGFQVGSSLACTSTALGNRYGACYLFSALKGKCTQVPNPCWNQYSLANLRLRDYCPTEIQLNVDSGTRIEGHRKPISPGEVAVFDQGWYMLGAAAVSTKGVFDVLEGSVEFYMRLNKAEIGTPDTGPVIDTFLDFPAGGSGDYNSSQACSLDSNSTGVACPKAAMVSSYGPIAYETALYTTPDDQAVDPCSGQSGCSMVNYFSRTLADGSRGLDECTDATPAAIIDSAAAGSHFHVKATFNASGAMTVILTQNNSVTGATETQKVTPEDLMAGTSPITQSTLAVIASASRRHGAVVSSQQVSSAVPGGSMGPIGDSCGEVAPGGGIDKSEVIVSKLSIKGVLLRGMADLCQ